jgi:hypothetical protein
MMVALVATLGLAFWAGRYSVPKRPASDFENNRYRPRSAERPPLRRPSQPSGPGAGAGAVTTAMQLRDIFKHSGGNMQVGTAMADATLAKMNGTEISQLVHDLAAAQATTPSYKFTLEINTACTRWAEIDPDAALKFALSNKQASFRSAAIGSIFAGIAKSDPALARAKLAMIDDPSLRRSAQASMLSALVVDRPDDWVAAIKADASFGRQFSLSSIASEWAIDDPVKAAARLKELPASMQKSAVASIAQVWAGKDSRAAMAWAQSLTDPSQRNLALGAVAGGVAAHDPDAAIASLDALSPAARRTGLAAVFRTLLDLDYEAALAKATSLSDPDDQKAALKLIAGGGDSYAYEDPFGNDNNSNSEQLTALLGKLPPGSMRNGVLSQLGQQLATCSSAEAESILAGYPVKEREKLQSGMLQSLAYSDPARALEIYQSLPPNKTESHSIYTIFSYLARQDPEALLKFSLASESPQEQSQGVSQAFGQLALNDPQAASRRLAALPPGPLYDGALASVTSAWAQADPDAARSWVDTLTGESKTRALNALIPAMVGNAPEAAAGMIGNLLASTQQDADGELSSVASQLSQSWVREDPEAAGKWISGLPDGNVKSSAISSMVYSWVREDFDGAAKWIDTLPDGQARDSGVQALVSGTDDKDPSTAFAWAATIGNESQRLSLLSQVVSQWKQKDANKARAAVDQADLSAVDRERLLQQLE